MKKSFLLLLCVLAVAAAGADTLDFVVLLDISESMLPYFDDTVHFLIGDILNEHLAAGDAFHLLSFADTPEIELTGTVSNQSDIDSALSRILLLQPLGKYTDLVSALKYLYTFTSNLKQHNRKKIVILTDGIHDPPPGSVFPVSEGDDSYRRVAEEIANSIRREGWEIGLMQFPAQDASSKTSALSEDATQSQDNPENLLGVLSEELDVDIHEYQEPSEELTHQVLGAPELVFPENLGKVRRRFRLPLLVHNFNGETVLVRLSGISWEGIDILVNSLSAAVPSSSSKKIRPLVRLPDSVKPGRHVLDLEMIFLDDLRIYPRRGSVSLELTEKPALDRGKTVKVLVYIGAILLGVMVLWGLYKIIRLVLDKMVFEAGSSTIVRSQGGTPGDRAVEMSVMGQNPNIGTRNVNSIRDGGTRSIGGGISSFLIYLYPLPSRIAEITRNGDTYQFMPIKNQFCESQSTVNDCLDRDIVIITKNQRKVIIRFKRYISALEKLNQLMHLTDAAGRPYTR